jgi:hypothetical protein
MPEWSQSFQVTVPTSAAAQDVADALAARGHRLVAVREVDHFQKDPSSFWYRKPSSRPGEAGHWDVFSVATGPVPDDDANWWQAQEDLEVRRITERFGGHTGGSGGGQTELLLSTFTRVGLVHELDEGTVGQRRLAAFADSPARAQPRAQRQVDESLPDGPGQKVHLDVVGDVDWAALEHAYGAATDVPGLLQGLAANDGDWGQHLDAFAGSVLHQGSTYSSSAPALRLIAQLAAKPQLAPKRRLDLLYTLFLAGSGFAQAEALGYRPAPHHAEVRASVIAASEEVLPLWPVVSRAEQRMLLLLAALSRHRVPDNDLNDPASRLATAMIRDEAQAQTALVDLATHNEDLIELAQGSTPTHSRLTAALERLLWEP